MTLFSWFGKIGLRVAFVAGALKVSLDNNVWSLKTSLGFEAYERLKQYVLPGTIIYKNKLPSMTEAQIKIGKKWNDNINSAFSCLTEVPSIVRDKLNKINLSK